MPQTPVDRAVRQGHPIKTVFSLHSNTTKMRSVNCEFPPKTVIHAFNGMIIQAVKHGIIIMFSKMKKTEKNKHFIT